MAVYTTKHVSVGNTVFHPLERERDVVRGKLMLILLFKFWGIENLSCDYINFYQQGVLRHALMKPNA